MTRDREAEMADVEMDLDPSRSIGHDDHIDVMSFQDYKRHCPNLASIEYVDVARIC